MAKIVTLDNLSVFLSEIDTLVDEKIVDADLNLEYATDDEITALFTSTDTEE